MFFDSKSILRSQSKEIQVFSAYFYGEKEKCAMILYFPVQNYFSTKYNTKMKKKYTQQLQKIPPPTGGGDIWPRFGKNSKLFLQITMGEMKKAPQVKVFVIRTIFTPKIAQKCKKLLTENSPPGGGTENIFNLGIPPPAPILKVFDLFAPQSHYFAQLIYYFVLSPDFVMSVMLSSST